MILLIYYAGYIAFMTQNTAIMRYIAKATGGGAPKSKSRRPSFSTGTWHHDKQDPTAKYAPTEGSNDAGAAVGAATGSGSGVGVDAPKPKRVSTVVEDMDELPGTPLPSMGEHHVEMPPMFVDRVLETTSAFGQGSGDGADNGAAALPNTPMEPPPTMGSDPKAPAPDPEKGGGEAEKAEDSGGGGEEEKSGASAERVKQIEEEIASLNKQKALREEIEAAEEAEDDARAAKLQQELFDLYEPLTQNQKLYLVTFTISLVWITILSYFMVTLMEKIGCAWGISSFIMGITFLAMGTSVPDALGSIAVAREGEGDMAVSNAIGSNVFDICIGLGIPWFIATLIDGKDRDIIASTESIVASTLILFAVVVVLFGSLYTSIHPTQGTRFTLHPEVGMILFGSYGAFVVFQIAWTAAGMD